MTDKQIIIDGVPVQDCCYFDYENDGYEDSCYIHQNECSAQNCYYKQLKRKEGIINILEQECTEKMEIIIALENKLTAKEQECETLASQLDFEVQKKECLERECKNNKIAHQMELDIYNQECLNLQEELKAKEQECEELKKKVYKYEQAEKYPAAFLWQEGLL